MGFILLPWGTSENSEPWVCGYSDSEERNQVFPGIGVLLGSWFAGAGQEWEELGTLVKENSLGSLEPRAWHMGRKGNKLLSPSQSLAASRGGSSLGVLG